MKFTRSLAAHSIRFACAAMLSLAGLSAYAGPGGQESNASLLNFSPAEKLSADNAAAILTTRLQLRSGLDEIQSAYIERPGDGIEVQRFNQFFKGVRVAHGTYTMTSKDGIAAYAFGKYFNIDGSTSIIPTLTEAEALDKALVASGARKFMWEVDKSVEFPKAELEFVEDFTSGIPDGKPRLAYAFDVYAAEPLSREKVFVDATSGKILLRDAILKHVAAKGKSVYSDTVNFEARLTGTTYILEDLSRGKGIITRNANNGNSAGAALAVASTTTMFARDPALDAHWGATLVYDYWKNTHNRLSWNGRDSSLRSYVHWGNNYVNASWNGSFMVYGDGGGGYGNFAALDICGHEIGHGVCQSTAGLVYSGESGGMNEGFSDIWGAVIENYGNPHEVDAMPKSLWAIGEEIGVTLRTMNNPKAYGQPDAYLGRNWIYTGAGCDGTNDNCGVHTNSGVLNYWFYLLVTGGKGTNDLGNVYEVASIGITKAAKIAYATELALSNTSNYAACRNASIAAATTLYGACSPELEAVTRAWYAVGVGANFLACAPQFSFGTINTTINEDAATNSCTPARIVNLPIVINGPAPTGGSPVVTVSVIGGNAVSGVDYSIPSNTVTFPSGSAAPQTLGIVVFDNGWINTNKYIDLVLSVAANGSNAVKSTVFDTVRVTLSNDDVAPLPGSTETRGVGVSMVTATTSSPFLSAYSNERGQYIYAAAEIASAGVRVGVPITSLSFNVTQKNSTVPFSGYTVKMAHTNQTSFTNSFLSPAFTTVYSGAWSTTTGWNAIPFSTPFIWDGVSNIIVEICYSNASSDIASDRVAATASGSGAATAFSNSLSGCSLNLVQSNIAYYRPIVRFTQTVPPASIATQVGDNRTWNVTPNQTVYFYTEPAHDLVASVLAAHKDMGCVNARVTKAGNGFISASGGKVRSVKEFELATDRSVAGDTFDVVLYFSNDELGSIDPNALYIVQTTSENDDTLLPSNTNIVLPSDIITGTTWTGFRGTFNNLKRFYLSDGALALGVGSVKGKNDGMWTGANPFRNAPVLFWNVTAQEHVNIRLTDITGKTVYTADRTLQAGSHSLELSSSNSYAPGTYILQVVRPGGVFTRQLIKQ